MKFFSLLKARLVRMLAFLGWAGAAGAGIAVLIAGGTYAALADRQEKQMEKVRFVQVEIDKLDKQISEIRKLKDTMAGLLARRRVVEALSKDRVVPSQLLDLLARQRPDGVYFVRVDQSGSQFKIAGYAASYSDVASFIKNIGAHPHFEYAVLTEIKTESTPKSLGYPIWFSVTARSTHSSPRAGGAAAVSARTSNPGDPK